LSHFLLNIFFKKAAKMFVKKYESFIFVACSQILVIKS